MSATIKSTSIFGMIKNGEYKCKCIWVDKKGKYKYKYKYLDWSLQIQIWIFWLVYANANMNTNICHTQPWNLSQTLHGWILWSEFYPTKHCNLCPFTYQKQRNSGKKMCFTMMLPKSYLICTFNHLFYTHIHLMHLWNIQNSTKKQHEVPLKNKDILI